MENDEKRLDWLLAAYRNACPDPEVSAEFMPELWRRIDASRGFMLAIRRWTSAFVTAATVVCITMAVYMAIPSEADSPVYTTTYMETLEDNATFETLAYSDVVSFEKAEAVELR